MDEMEMEDFEIIASRNKLTRIEDTTKEARSKDGSGMGGNKLRGNRGL